MVKHSTIVSKLNVNKPQPSLFEEKYGNTTLYHLFMSGLTVFVGGMIAVLGIAVVMTLVRYSRALFKIHWSKADENQMHDYYDAKTVAPIVMFSILFGISVALLAQTEFGWASMYYTAIFVGIYAAYQALDFAREQFGKMRFGPAPKIKTE